jgi:hypothetical protein
MSREHLGATQCRVCGGTGHERGDPFRVCGHCCCGETYRSTASTTKDPAIHIPPTLVRTLALLLDSPRYPFEAAVRSDLPAIKALQARGWLEPCTPEAGPYVLTTVGRAAADLAADAYAALARCGAVS